MKHKFTDNEREQLLKYGWSKTALNDWSKYLTVLTTFGATKEQSARFTSVLKADV